MKTFLICILVFHGFLHLEAFLKAFKFIKLEKLQIIISRKEGLFWLVASILIILSTIFYAFNLSIFWLIGIMAIIVSQSLIFSRWRQARFGTIINVIFLVPVTVSCLNFLPGSYSNMYNAEVKKGIERLGNMPILTEADIQPLPAPVQKYIRYTGSIGKPRAQNFQAVFEGGIRKSLEDSFMDLHVRQCNFYDEPERLFYMESKMYGVPYSGLHMYRGNNATMQVKIASIFPMINASGDIMLQSETVTMFADMCFMAPAALINKNIQWELIDSLTVKGKFTNAGKTIGATLYFNPKGELINFISMDRYMSADGKSFANYPWSTPTSDYKYFHGIRLGSYGEAIWQLPKGKLCYGKFRTVDIEYNVKQVK